MLELMLGKYRAKINQQQLANCPIGLYLSTIVEYNGDLFTYGGTLGPSRTNNIYKYTGQANSWALLATTTAQPISHNAVVLEDSLYSTGGSTGNVLVSVNLISGLSTTKKSASKNYPTSSRDVVVKVNGKLWTLIGTEFHVYDHLTNSWELKSAAAGAPPSTLTDSYFSVVGTTICIFGGVVGTATVNSFYIYDTLTNSWLTPNDIARPGARKSGSMVSFNDRLYVINGQNNGGVKLKEIWMYDLSASIWTLIQYPALALPQYWFASTTDENSAYLLGGLLDGTPDVSTGLFKLTF